LAQLILELVYLHRITQNNCV